MGNLLTGYKAEIEMLGDRMDQAVTLAGQQLNEVVERASDQLDDRIKQVSDAVHDQRQLTKTDIEALIDYATVSLGKVLDERIEKLRIESSTMITDKIEQVRSELSEAATEQKRGAIRNAMVAVAASIIVGMISIYYKKYLGGDINLVDIFRSVLLSLTVGYAVWLIFKQVSAYIQSSRLKRNAVIVGLRYFDVLRPKGALWQFFGLAAIIGLWAVANYSNWFQHLIGKI
ncbi:MAG: hypothetical protein V4588_08950 [Pseudomonadota bacterium]